jgi:hypothetical protein
MKPHCTHGQVAGSADIPLIVGGGLGVQSLPSITIIDAFLLKG